MADYTQYATPAEEWIEFEKDMPPPISEQDTTIEQRKQMFNDRRAKLFTDVLGHIEGVVSRDVSIPTSDDHSIEAKIYHPEGSTGLLPLYIHLHGGGWHFGNIETEDVSCRLISLRTNTVVMNVNYRHTPEWVFPTPVQDAWDALQWITQAADQCGVDKNCIIVGGISSGASLACATAFRDLENSAGLIKGIVLTIPPTVHETLFPRDLVKNGYSSLEQNADAPILPLKRTRAFKAMYKPDPSHPSFSPLVQPDERFINYPPTCFHVAGLDPLRDEGLLFSEKLKRVGVETRVKIYPGYPHGFMGFPQLKVSKRWREDLYEDIVWLVKRSKRGQ